VHFSNMNSENVSSCRGILAKVARMSTCFGMNCVFVLFETFIKGKFSLA